MAHEKIYQVRLEDRVGQSVQRYIAATNREQAVKKFRRLVRNDRLAQEMGADTAPRSYKGISQRRLMRENIAIIRTREADAELLRFIKQYKIDVHR